MFPRSRHTRGLWRAALAQTKGVAQNSPSAGNSKNCNFKSWTPPSGLLVREVSTNFSQPSSSNEERVPGADSPGCKIDHPPTSTSKCFRSPPEMARTEKGRLPLATRLLVHMLQRVLARRAQNFSEHAKCRNNADGDTGHCQSRQAIATSLNHP